jgi:outer membrane lipoprotein-sorting protein
MFFYEKPDRLRWEMHQPYASIMIFNGGRFAKYNRDNGKYVRMKSGMERFMKEALKQIMTMMNADFVRMKKLYKVEVGKEKNYVVTLTPLSDAMRRIISSIVLDVDATAYYVKKVKIFEAQGDSIEISFSALQENMPLSENLFDLNEPVLPE